MLPFVVLITTSVLAGVPVDLEEAAQVFGTSRLGAFWRVVMPLALPGLAAAASFAVLMSYNEVFAASILTLERPTLPALVLNALSSSPDPYKFCRGVAAHDPDVRVHLHHAPLHPRLRR